jgi:translocation and assembly module TamA
MLLAVSATASARTRSDLAYRVTLSGVSDGKLRAFLKRSSNLPAQADTLPQSRMALEQRVREDRARLSDALKSEGYYTSSVQSRIDFRARPIDITLAIEPGPRFHLEGFEITYVDERESIVADAREAAAAAVLAAGAPARAAEILAAQDRIVEALRRSGYPFAAIRAPQYAINLDNRSMIVRLEIAAGGYWRFGEIIVEGLSDVEPGYVLRKAPWSRGARFDLSKLAVYRQTLESTGLFRSIQINPAPESMDAQGELPVRVTLAERKPRTIGVGFQYSSNEGPGVRIFWQHRNFLHRARRLDLSLSGNPLRQAFEGSYRQPEFIRSDQALFSRLGFTHEARDAFNARSLVSALGLERQLRPTLFASAGIEIERSRVEDVTGRSKVTLVNFPLVGNYDTSNDFLDPTRGMRLRVTVSPSIGDNKGPVTFLTVESAASAYFPVIKKPETVLALRARLGAITGANVDDVPANHRFYAGGGGSLRAYGYRDVGPLDAQNDPIGGRSVTEIGVEARIRASKQFGVVPFIEGGNVYERSVPGFERFLWGAGLGLRYFSAVGPLRLDVAVPLNRRRGVDAQVQVYVSIGQAF